MSKGDTIGEAAEKAGLDPATVADTLAAYNEYCKSGVDKDFGKSSDKLIALDQGPYYIVETIPSVKSTLGGLRIDDQARVLNAADEPIVGLYAAGEVTGVAAIVGNNWYGGPNLQSGSTFGYTAVHTVIEDLLK